MSFHALAWAVRQKLPCTQKLVLLMLADRHNKDTGQCNPSHDLLADDCGLTRRSVMEQVAKLAEAGYLSIRHRVSNNVSLPNQYILKFGFGVQEEVIDPDEVVNHVHGGSEPRSLGSEPRSPGVVNHVHGGSEPRSHKPGREPVNEPGREPKEKSAPLSVAPSVLVEAGFSPEVAGEFIAHKARMKAPLTARAWADHVREAQKAGWSAVAAAEKVMAKSWKGFEAKYVANERPGGGPLSRQSALEARNRAVLDEVFAGAR